jgi:N-acetylneuraminic acid mutarotase
MADHRIENLLPFVVFVSFRFCRPLLSVKSAVVSTFPRNLARDFLQYTCERPQMKRNKHMKMKKQTNSTIKAHLLRGAFYLLLLLAVCAIPFALAQPGSIVTGIQTSAGLPPSKTSHPAAAGLSFADRVAYQSAIEDVYWRHRIWPDTNASAKPSLDKVMSQTQIEKKVEEYLRNSQALEDYWQRPISADQLQADMERMASHTQQPEVLRELFEALGNDPFVIAECLARPILTERLIADLSAQHQTGRLESLRTAQLRTASITTMLGEVAYTLPEIASPSSGCTDDTWTPTTLTNAPDARDHLPAVWTGTEMIVWGGRNGSGVLNSGGRYNPSTDSWTATSTTNAPEARQFHSAVWSGSEMIVWTGESNNNGAFLNTGGRYNPSINSWTAISTNNAPTARVSAPAVRTGSEMMAWGGMDRFSNSFNTGGRYNPSTDSWTATRTINAPAARRLHTAVWSGSEMIVWGGVPETNTGGRYNPSTNSWTATSTTGAPADRRTHTAVWTGSEMIVWGGNFGNTYFNTGGRYNPVTNSWTATSTTNAPEARSVHTAVWTGSEMIVWGGTADTSGGRYCAQSGSPTPTPTPSPTPTATARPTATTTPTPTLTPTPRPRPTARPRPTPAPRP